MEILERAEMPDGTHIQLERWSREHSPEYAGAYELSIGAYPKARRADKYNLIKGNDSFRLTISSNPYKKYSDDDVRADFEALQSGEKSLRDLSAYFWNGEKDMWYLGMDVAYKGY